MNQTSESQKTKKSLFLATLLGACVYFSVFSMVLLMLESILKAENSTTTVNVAQFIFLYPCALLISVGRTALKNAKNPVVARLSHFLAVLISIMGFVWAPYAVAYSRKGSDTIIVLASVIALYWLVYGIEKFVRYRIHFIKKI